MSLADIEAVLGIIGDAPGRRGRVERDLVRSGSIEATINNFFETGLVRACDSLVERVGAKIAAQGKLGHFGLHTCSVFVFAKNKLVRGCKTLPSPALECPTDAFSFQQENAVVEASSSSIIPSGVKSVASSSRQAEAVSDVAIDLTGDLNDQVLILEDVSEPRAPFENGTFSGKNSSRSPKKRPRIESLYEEQANDEDEDYPAGDCSKKQQPAKRSNLLPTDGESLPIAKRAKIAAHESSRSDVRDDRDARRTEIAKVPPKKLKKVTKEEALKEIRVIFDVSFVNNPRTGSQNPVSSPLRLLTLCLF